jgi:FixJ family two-component response regulator
MNASHPRKSALVYAVDDLPPILDLYVLLLESIGCTVAAFHDRAVALAALGAEQRKPDLLITDYCGGSVPVKQFLRQSVALHPRLRILMASGLFDPGLRTGDVRPDLFIQKPFTNEEFTRAVEAALAVSLIPPPKAAVRPRQLLVKQCRKTQLRCFRWPVQFSGNKPVI